MNRLTNEFVLSNIENGFHLDDEHIKFVKDKLEYADKMKSIENDLGCPLEVVFKALKNGIYSSDKTFYPMVNMCFRDKTLYCQAKFKNYIVVCIKDYKKTWWLSETKE